MLLTTACVLRWARSVDALLLSPRDQVPRLPVGPGVYRFRDAGGRVLYLGRSVSLRRRVASYWGDLGDRGHLAAMVARIAQVEAVPCASAHEAAWLERNLLQRRKPPWNRSPSGGQEAEVWIRLSQSAAAPGVTIRHQPRPGEEEARYFGPYLGGQKARAAVSGLRRVLPLGHDLAAVLDRDPAAVAALRAELIRRRDAASAKLGFEFAGRVQAELEAVDWITAEQRVTQAQPCDFDVHGWAGGVLVRFEVRAGRLSGWTQRARAAPDLAATRSRPEWADFASRCAELAARLRSPLPN